MPRSKKALVFFFCLLLPVACFSQQLADAPSTTLAPVAHPTTQFQFEAPGNTALRTPSLEVQQPNWLRSLPRSGVPELKVSQFIFFAKPIQALTPSAMQIKKRVDRVTNPHIPIGHQLKVPFQIEP